MLKRVLICLALCGLICGCGGVAPSAGKAACPAPCGTKPCAAACVAGTADRAISCPGRPCCGQAGTPGCCPQAGMSGAPAASCPGKGTCGCHRNQPVPPAAGEEAGAAQP